MAKKKTKTRTARKAPARKPTTALVRRSKVVDAEVMPPGSKDVGGYVVAADGSLQLGALGLVELVLTAKEESVLAEPVPIEKIEWKPRVKDGPPEIPYLPHHVYTGWLNRAFGRMGWSLVPIGKPVKTEEGVVLLPYVLHVHKLPVAFAWGEQEYFANNKQQTYGDVVESTNASALRRCMKRLHVGAELWDRAWLAELPRPTGGRNFTKHSDRKQGRKPERKVAPVEHADLDKVITDEQRLRLWNIARRVGRDDAEVQNWLKKRYKVKSSSDISRRDYDGIVKFIEGKGPLQEREPGEDA